MTAKWLTTQMPWGQWSYWHHVGSVPQNLPPLIFHLQLEQCLEASSLQSAEMEECWLWHVVDCSGWGWRVGSILQLARACWSMYSNVLATLSNDYFSKEGWKQADDVVKFLAHFKFSVFSIPPHTRMDFNFARSVSANTNKKYTKKQVSDGRNSMLPVSFTHLS